jgi:UDP-N-acetyl-D-mannosaminuronic acid transferase (WecB/TagA/CpsF family)
MHYPFPTKHILGLDFFAGTPDQLLEALDRGGLLVAPAAPPLAELDRTPDYHAALQSADIRLPDSAFMTLLALFMKGIVISRFSGLKLMNLLFERGVLRAPVQTFWVMPNQNEWTVTQKWLREKQGINVENDHAYVAPQYPAVGKIEDAALMKHIQSIQPKYIIIALGGGTQERLGAWLKTVLPPSTAILCTGAAISFLTGTQAPIPAWADRFYLGFLWRIARNPKVFLKRYVKALRLMRVM